MKNLRKNFKQERTRIYDELSHDSYRSTKKYPDPTICTDCGALFTKGRWSWDDIPDQVSQTICPACQRIKDNYPAGIIEINGPFFIGHRVEIMNLVKNLNNLEVSEHPLERIMSTNEENHKTVIKTTGSHIARRIGDALFRAYDGNLIYNYDENLIRVSWER